ncbi:MAG: electron transport complex subunit RsxA [Pseudomonadales bacterium]|nr:electron transport complex subunit RsxA [Pseudomonadales bacterium]
MADFVYIIIGTVLVNNVVLVQFLGLCPFMGVSNNIGTATGMGLATTFVLTLSACCGWVIEHFILVPLDLSFLRTLSFILVVATVVQFTELYLKKSSQSLYQSLGIFLPLITTNCAVLGVALLTIKEGFGFLESLVYGLGAALGFSLVMVIFAGLRQRLALANVPESFSGAPIGLITAGVLSMVFMGFSGLA